MTGGGGPSYSDGDDPPPTPASGTEMLSEVDAVGEPDGSTLSDGAQLLQIVTDTAVSVAWTRSDVIVMLAAWGGY